MAATFTELYLILYACDVLLYFVNLQSLPIQFRAAKTFIAEI